MANKHVVGIELRVTSGGTQATDTLSRSLDALYKQIVTGNEQTARAMRDSAKASRDLASTIRSSMASVDRSTERSTVGMIHFNQAVASATTGFSHMHRYGVAALRGIGSAIAGVTADSASRLDTTMANLDIVLGRIGNSTSEPLEATYQAAIGRIRELAMETQFSMEQVGDSFTRLFQAGFDAEDAIGTLDSVLAFTSASGGAVQLEQAASLAALSVTALGSEVENIDRNFAQMIRATQETRLQMSDFSTLFQSMQTSSATFSKSTTQDLLAVVGAQRQMGRSTAQAGNDLANTARSMGYLVRALATGTEDGTPTGMRGGRIRQRAARTLGVGLSDFVGDDGGYLDLVTMIERISGRFEEASQRLGRARAEGELQALFGSQQARNLIVNSARYQEAYGRSIRELAGAIDDSGNILADAQARVLETFEGRTALIAGVWDNLKAEFGLQLFPLLKPAMEALFRFLGGVSQIVRSQPETMRSLVRLGAYITTLIGVFTAMAGVGMLLGTVMMVTAPLMTALGSATLSLTSIMKAFFTVGLRPLLALMVPVGVLFIAATAAVAGFMHVFQTNFLGSRTRLMDWLSEFSQAFNVLRRIITAEGIDSSEWDALTERQQLMVIGLRRTLTTLQAGWEGLLAGLKMGLIVFQIIGRVAALAFSHLVAWMGRMNIRMGQSETLFQGTRAGVFGLTFAVGLLLGMYVTYRTVMAAVAVMTGVLTVAKMAYAFALKLVRIETWKSIGVSVLAAAKFLLVAAAVVAIVYGFSQLSPEMRKFVVVAGIVSAALWLMRGRLLALAAARSGIVAAGLALNGFGRILLVGKVALLALSFVGGYVFGTAMRSWARDGVMYFRSEIESLIGVLDRLWSRLSDNSFVTWFNKYFGSGWGESGIGGLIATGWKMHPVAGLFLDPIQEITRELENERVMAGAREEHGTPIASRRWVPYTPPTLEEQGWRVVGPGASGASGGGSEVNQRIDASVRVDSLTIQAADTSEEAVNQLLDQIERNWGLRVQRELRRQMQGT